MSTVLEPQPNETKSDLTSAQQPQSDVRKSSTSKEWKTTYWYLGGALAALAITAVVEWGNRPAPIEEFGRIGEEFYADFVDPTLATALEVYAFDA